jgi:hypothetical protein
MTMKVRSLKIDSETDNFHLCYIHIFDHWFNYPPLLINKFKWEKLLQFRDSDHDQMKKTWRDREINLGIPEIKIDVIWD